MKKNRTDLGLGSGLQDLGLGPGSRHLGLFSSDWDCGLCSVLDSSDFGPLFADPGLSSNLFGWNLRLVLDSSEPEPRTPFADFDLNLVSGNLGSDLGSTSSYRCSCSISSSGEPGPEPGRASSDSGLGLMSHPDLASSDLDSLWSRLDLGSLKWSGSNKDMGWSTCRFCFDAGFCSNLGLGSGCGLVRCSTAVTLEKGAKTPQFFSQEKQRLFWNDPSQWPFPRSKP